MRRTDLCIYRWNVQDLTVTLVSERQIAELELVESDSMRRTICAKTIGCEQEWRLHKFVNVWNKIVSKISNAETLQYSGFCCAARRPSDRIELRSPDLPVPGLLLRR